MSVDARVVLLVEDDKTMYTMATSVSTKRWTLTLPKFDKPFGVRFHFERFLGTDVGWMFTRLAFTRALTGADDHAHLVLPKEVKRPCIGSPPEGSQKGIGSPGKHLHASLDLHGCGGRKVDSRVPCPRYKGFVVEPVPAQPPPESGFDPKVQ
uniref:Uncharacterized protein n=1 Tax=Fagus sylvatica TaxID=28930 RepID=A0A2N9HCR7_FAGSY